MNKLGLGLAAALTTLPGTAGAEKIALRAGLWEVNLSSALSAEQSRLLSPKISDALLHKVPSAQRAEFKRMFESGELLRNALNTIETLCFTEQDLDDGITLDTDLDESCQVHSVTTHRNAQRVSLICDGPHAQDQGAGVIDIAVKDPTTFTATMTRSVAVNARPLDVKVDIAAKWLDTQCGEEAEEEEETR